MALGMQKTFLRLIQWTLVGLTTLMALSTISHSLNIEGLKEPQVSLSKFMEFSMEDKVIFENVARTATTFDVAKSQKVDEPEYKDVAEDGDYMDEEMKLRIQTFQKSNEKSASKVKTQRKGIKTWCAGSINFRTKNASTPIVALSSFPGSGNTWVRFLLQQATGIYTGSIYKDGGLMAAGFKGEFHKDSTVLTVKIHHCDPNLFDKVILLVRHPKPALLAEFNRQHGIRSEQNANGHTGIAGTSLFHTQNWANYVAKQADVWQQFHINWLKQDKYKEPGKKLIVFYEDLKSNTERELRRMLKFLDVEVNEDVLKCALSDEVQGGIFRRNKTKAQQESEEDYFTKKMSINLERKWRRITQQLL